MPTWSTATDCSPQTSAWKFTVGTRFLHFCRVCRPRSVGCYLQDYIFAVDPGSSAFNFHRPQTYKICAMWKQVPHLQRSFAVHCTSMPQWSPNTDSSAGVSRQTSNLMVDFGVTNATSKVHVPIASGLPRPAALPINGVTHMRLQHPYVSHLQPSSTLVQTAPISHNG